MSDFDSTPLSDDERAELEALRAEKARREEAERARRERAELEALRAEAKSSQRPSSKLDAVAAQDPADKTFGQRMVTSSETDDDGLPAMPPAQKIIIAVCIIAALGFVVYSVLR